MCFRPPWDAASLKYFLALLQFYMRQPPETAADGLRHALLLLQEAADKFRDSPQCAELLHLYRAKLVAFHEGDTKKAMSDTCCYFRCCLLLPLPLMLLLLLGFLPLHVAVRTVVAVAIPPASALETTNGRDIGSATCAFGLFVAVQC